MSWTHQLAGRGLLPDAAARLAVRRLALARLERAARPLAEAPERRLGDLLERPALPAFWRPGEPPLPPALAGLADEVLGDHGLAAAAHWPIWAKGLSAAEEEMLGLVQRRAAIETGQRVLVVAGRRAGVASFLAAEAGVEPVVWTPRREDAERIRERAERAGGRLEVRSGDLAAAAPEGEFDRVVTLEEVPGDDPGGFLAALAARLKPGGRLFVQLACHRRYGYPLAAAEVRWLGVAAGSLVPATDLLPHLVPRLLVHRHRELSGEHYERTLAAWRRRLEERRDELVAGAAETVGARAARRAVEAWRLALLARETMFGLRGGQEWWISHYTLDRVAG